MQLVQLLQYLVSAHQSK